ncbi:MAG: NADP-dependent oxidoreductase [Thermoactinospora sp.]|nr:NADP-dependent oxidoreductase [Thermoactinospora sp.]
MKAIRFHEFGGPEVLVHEEVPTPRPAPGEALVKVHAVGVNPPDWYARTGFATIPADMRPTLALPYIPGTDVSGVVVEGAGEWQEGDEVYALIRFPPAPGGPGGRAYAEYVTVPADQLARKPRGLDHVRAAAVPMAGLTAYQYAVDHVRPASGRTVLVNGAAGGVGHFAAQLAKDQGNEVIAVASGRHADFLKSLGVDRFIDYTQEALPAGLADVVVDTVGGDAMDDLLDVVRPGGTFAAVFPIGRLSPERAAERGVSIVSAQVRSSGRQLGELAELIDAGRLVVGVDGVYPLAHARQAHERAARGHLQGKIVLEV